MLHFYAIIPMPSTTNVEILFMTFFPSFELLLFCKICSHIQGLMFYATSLLGVEKILNLLMII